MLLLKKCPCYECDGIDNPRYCRKKDGCANLIEVFEYLAWYRKHPNIAMLIEGFRKLIDEIKFVFGFID